MLAGGLEEAFELGLAQIGVDQHDGGSGVGQREGELQRLVRPRLLHVVAGDRDRVELRHVLRRVLDDVADDPHARLGRVDVGVADHELLEDVVLDGPRELLRLNPLLLGRSDVERQHRQHHEQPEHPRGIEKHQPQQGPQFEGAEHAAGATPTGRGAQGYSNDLPAAQSAPRPPSP